MTEYTIEQRIIYRLVEQHCTMPNGELFSGFLSANAAAMLGGWPPSVLLLLFVVLAVAIAAIPMLY